jgi:hypothetical protein
MGAGTGLVVIQTRAGVISNTKKYPAKLLDGALRIPVCVINIRRTAAKAAFDAWTALTLDHATSPASDGFWHTKQAERQQDAFDLEPRGTPARAAPKRK